MGKALTFLGTLLSIITGVIFLFQYCSDNSSYDGPDPVIEIVNDAGAITDSIIDDSDSGNGATGQELDNTEVPEFDYVTFAPQTQHNYLTWSFALVVKNVRNGSLDFKVRMIVYDEYPTGDNTPIHYGKQGRAIYDQYYSEKNVDPDYARLELYSDGVNIDRLDLESGKEYYLKLQVIYNGYVVLESAPKPFKRTIVF